MASQLISYILLAASPLPFSFAIWNAYGASQVADWPTVEGTLASVSLEERQQKSDMEYVVKVEYRYAVDGVSYQGDQIAPGYSGSSNRERQEEIQHALSRGKKVVVRYDPANPARAYLGAGVTRGIQESLIFGGYGSVFLFVFFQFSRLSRADRGDAIAENLIVE